MVHAFAVALGEASKAAELAERLRLFGEKTDIIATPEDVLRELGACSKKLGAAYADIVLEESKKMREPHPEIARSYRDKIRTLRTECYRYMPAEDGPA